MMDGMETQQDQTEAAAPFPSLPKRIVQAFVAPGELCSRLAERPVWVWAALALMAIAAVQFALIPIEVWNDIMRQSALEQGQAQQIPEWMGTFTRVFQIVGAPVGIALYLLVKSAVIAVIFVFVLGDEGRYTQYLSVLTHSQFIPILVGLLLVPLRISSQDPQLTLNMGTFFFMFEEGYLARVLRMLDLSQLWAWVVIAQGAHAIDPRRTVKSAMITVFIWAGLMALLFGFIPMPGM